MKKLLILLFSILISFNSYGVWFDKTVCVEIDVQDRDGIIYLPNKTKPFKGKNLCKYESGQIKSKGKFKDGKKDGKWTEWHENSEIKFERNYKNGIEIGEGDSIITRFSNGQIESKGCLLFGRELDGKCTFWFENGQKSYEVNYKDGKLDGKQTYWFENGQIQIENNYKDDECISGDWC